MGASRDKQLSSAIETLTEKQKKAVLSMVKAFAREQPYDHWDDANSTEEMYRHA
ncbi:MAG: hypothetical protein V4649_18015 [Bacteroidota bacterium]